MGRIHEVVKEILLEEAYEKAFNEAYEKAYKEGFKIGELKKATSAIRNMLKAGYQIDRIYGVFDVPNSFVLRRKRELEKEHLIIKELERGELNEKEIAEKLKVHPVFVLVIKGVRKKQCIPSGIYTEP